MLSANNCRMSGPTNWIFFQAGTVARHRLQFAEDSSVVAMDKTYLTESVRNMQPLLDQRYKIYHTRDLKPKFWDEIRKKLNIAVK
jgi:hypothetical protein